MLYILYSQKRAESILLYYCAADTEAAQLIFEEQAFQQHCINFKML